jgi:hypothetical protein
MLEDPARFESSPSRDGNRHVGICVLHTYTAHRSSWIPAGRTRQMNVRKEGNGVRTYRSHQQCDRSPRH